MGEGPRGLGEGWDADGVWDGGLGGRGCTGAGAGKAGRRGLWEAPRPGPGGGGGAAQRSPPFPALTRFSTRRLAPGQAPAGPTKPLCAGRAGGRPAGLTPTRAAAGHGPAGTRAVCGAPPPGPGRGCAGVNGAGRGSGPRPIGGRRERWPPMGRTEPGTGGRPPGVSGNPHLQVPAQAGRGPRRGAVRIPKAPGAPCLPFYFGEEISPEWGQHLAVGRWQVGI